MTTRAHGFTLIELTIVLALIALLLTIAAPRYFHVLDHGKVSVQRQNVAAMRDAIDKYYGDLGRYPDDLEDLVRKKYLRAIPIDPVTEKADWNVVAPEDQTLGRVFDVASARAADGDSTRAGGPVRAASSAKSASGTPDKASDAR